MTTWPPAQLDVILPAMRRWDAWYASRTDVLSQIYAHEGQRPSFHRDGLIGTVRRFFWGANAADTPSRKLHVPVASDLCRASSDLLFAEPPTLTVADPGTQTRLDLIMAAGAHTELAAAAELGAALGGTYMRVAWDTAIAQHPFLTRVDADHALPEFTWGRLTAVTFWRTVREDGGTVWRHLEWHGLEDGIGVIQHTLHRGTATELGQVRPLTEQPATGDITTDEDGFVSTHTPGLDVVYVPNQTPNRTWRNHPVGANLGRSDLDGVEPLMDALDEAWSSWMRDLRVGKARIVAAQQLLDDHGPGQGASLNLDREVYEAVNAPPGSMTGGAELPLKAVQFTIRVQEHQATVEALLQQILRTAGYSAQTFGMDSAGAAMTATEVQAKERSSFLTRDRKVRPWLPALTALAAKALAIDAAVFRSAADPTLPVTVEFGDTVQESQIALAQTAQAMFQAQAASARVRVQMMHPDWSEDDVDEEVARIAEEFGVAAAPDPDALGVGGFGLHPLEEDPTEEPPAGDVP